MLSSRFVCAGSCCLLLLAACSRTSLWAIPDDDDRACTEDACEGGNQGGRGGSAGFGGEPAGGRPVGGAPAGGAPAGSGGGDLAGRGGANQSGSAGVAGNSGSAGSPGCPVGLTQCETSCVDPSSHPHHCGGCGRQCTGDTVCLAGVCACAPEFAECGGECVDLGIDDRNCGSCDQTCDGVLECRNAECRPPECDLLAFDAHFLPVALTENVAPFELTGDGFTDLALITDSSVVPLLNTGGGAFTQLPPIFLADLSDLLIAVASGDLNHDGFDDLVIAHYWTGKLSVLISTGMGTFQAVVEYATPSRPTAIAIADVTGDAVPDAIVHAAAVVSIHANDGSGNLLPYGSYGAGTANSVPATSLALADVNGDQQLDIATTDSSGGLIALLRSKEGKFPYPEYYQVGQWPNGIVAGDIDADGDRDLLFSDTESGLVRVLANNGDGIFVETANYTVGPSVTSIALAELDGYPGLELAALKTDEDLLFVFPGFGSPSSAPLHYPTKDNPWILVATDLDADGIDDLAIANGGGTEAGVGSFLTRCTLLE